MTFELKIQIAGMPLTAHRRLKNQLDAWGSNLSNDVTVRFEPSFHPNKALIDKHTLNRIEDNVQEGFVHIIVVSTREWGALRQRFEFDCRVIAVHFSSYDEASWNALQQSLDNSVRFERRWCRAIRPTDAKGPLFLPVRGFQPIGKYERFWEACDCYNNFSALDSAVELLRRVRGKHHRRIAGGSRYWVDSGDKMFKIDPTKHALYPDQRLGKTRFRFCSQVPPGFHYDVVHTRGKEFNLVGKQRIYNRVRRANIDPWGSVRLP